MGRALKFRVYDIEGEAEDTWQMVYISSPDQLKHCMDMSYYLMQYTGMEDSKGVEIYEGDIVYVDSMQVITPEGVLGNKPFSGPVVFKLGAYCIDNDIYDGSFIEMHGARFEVIGNTYENPEL